MQIEPFSPISPNIRKTRTESGFIVDLARTIRSAVGYTTRGEA